MVAARAAGDLVSLATSPFSEPLCGTRATEGLNAERNRQSLHCACPGDTGHDKDTVVVTAVGQEETWRVDLWACRCQKPLRNCRVNSRESPKVLSGPLCFKEFKKTSLRIVMAHFVCQLD